MLTIDEIKQAVTKVGKKYNIKSAYLFGSYAKGEADENSDVDILVDSRLKGMRFVGFVEQIREALGDKDVDVLDSAYIDSGSKILDEISKTGVLVYER